MTNSYVRMDVLRLPMAISVPLDSVGGGRNREVWVCGLFLPSRRSRLTGTSPGGASYRAEPASSTAEAVRDDGVSPPR